MCAHMPTLSHVCMPSTCMHLRLCALACLGLPEHVSLGMHTQPLSLSCSVSPYVLLHSRLFASLSPYVLLHSRLFASLSPYVLLYFKLFASLSPYVLLHSRLFASLSPCVLLYSKLFASLSPWGFGLAATPTKKQRPCFARSWRRALSEKPQLCLGQQAARLVVLLGAVSCVACGIGLR